MDVPIISNEVADKQLDISAPFHSELTQRMISTGAVGTNRQGACHGDSGGPLVYKRNGQNDIQIGVVSWGVGKCVGGNNSPSIYARLSRLVGWINSEAWKFANIRGNSIVCYNSSQTFTLQNVPYFITATDWQTSPNLTIVSSNNNSVTVRAKSSNTTGNGWVKATLSNRVVLQEGFDVGIPDLNYRYNLQNTLLHNSSTSLLENAWNQLRVACSSGCGDLNGGRWQYSATHSSIRNGSNNTLLIRSNSLRGSSFKIYYRSCNTCGCSNWQYSWFAVIPGGLIPTGVKRREIPLAGF